MKSKNATVNRGTQSTQYIRAQCSSFEPQFVKENVGGTREEAIGPRLPLHGTRMRRTTGPAIVAYYSTTM